MRDSPATKRSRRAKETFDPEYDEFVAWKSKQYGGWVEAEKAGSKKTAKDLLPSRNTMSKRIDAKLEGVKVDVLTKFEQLKSIGGGLTLDFAKKNVDHLAVTANFVDNNCCKQDFVIAFSRLPPSVKKTSLYVQKLLSEQLQEIGIQARDMSNLFVTTDEGSNVCCLGGENHMPCICHIGATIAKRATRPYKISDLSSQMEEACAEVEVSLHLMEKWVNKLRQNEELRNAASKALKWPAETRWLSYFNMVEALCNNIDVQ
uniref:Transposase n=1 Tax=Ditylenchus dipsaci TaxID=166011 RepID=A0A915E4H0_9BILA